MEREIHDKSKWRKSWKQTTLLCLIYVSVAHSAGISLYHEVKEVAPVILDTLWLQEEVSGTSIKYRSELNYRRPGILPNIEHEWKSSYSKGVQIQDESIGTSEKSDTLKNYPKVFPCPVEMNILPCVCSELDGQLHLRCPDVSSQDELQSVFLQYFPVQSFASLTISISPNLQTLGDIFNGVSFEYVSIEHTGLHFVSEYFLVDSLDTLKSLVIINSKITSKSFPFLSLGSYKNLENLYIRGNDLTYLPVLRSDSLIDVQIFFGSIAEIGPDVLQGLSNIEVVGLSENHLTSLPFGLTSNLPELFTISFGFNNITRIESGVFDFTSTFFSIILAHNQISVVEPGAFVVPPMTFNVTGGYLDVDLSYNQITTLDEEVYGEIFPYLYEIDFSNNPLLCACDIAWVILNDAFLAKVSPGTSCKDGTLLVNIDPDEFGQFC